MRQAVIRPAADDLADLRDRLVVLEATVAGLVARRGPRDDPRDVDLVEAIHQAAEDLPFTVTALLKRAEQIPTLREALLAADITSGKELGWLLKRFEGSALTAGFTVTRSRFPSRDGILWQVLRVARVVERETRTG